MRALEEFAADPFGEVIKRFGVTNAAQGVIFDDPFERAWKQADEDLMNVRAESLLAVAWKIEELRGAIWETAGGRPRSHEAGGEILVRVAELARDLGIISVDDLSRRLGALVDSFFRFRVALSESAGITDWQLRLAESIALDVEQMARRARPAIAA